MGAFGAQMGAGSIPGFGAPGIGGPGAISKPNPYVIAETKAKGPEGVEVSYKYPRSKIFVGGLDFKLTVEELKEHFQ